MDWISVKNFDNALRNRYAHLHKKIDAADVRASRQLAWPLRLFHTCPRSDGAAAVVMTSAETAAGHATVAHVRGFGCAADVYRIGDRIEEDGTDFAIPRSQAWACEFAYRQAGIDDPRRQLT